MPKAKPFWIKNDTAKKPAVKFEDISALCTGVSDDCWKYGTD